MVSRNTQPPSISAASLLEQTESQEQVNKLLHKLKLKTSVENRAKTSAMEKILTQLLKEVKNRGQENIEEQLAHERQELAIEQGDLRSHLAQIMEEPVVPTRPPPWYVTTQKPPSFSLTSLKELIRGNKEANTQMYTKEMPPRFKGHSQVGMAQEQDEGGRGLETKTSVESSDKAAMALITRILLNVKQANFKLQEYGPRQLAHTAVLQSSWESKK